MKMFNRLGVVAVAAAALVTAVPALANTHSVSHSSSASHKCRPHKVAYIEWGTVDPSTTADNSTGSWTGMLAVNVKRTDRAARADKGTLVSYDLSTFPNLRVRFDGGTSSFTGQPTERVKLIGKIEKVAKKCPALDPAPTPTFHRIVVHPAAS